MKKIFTIVAMLMAMISLNAAEVTVANGTASSEKAPVRGYYGDCFTHNQVIYPEAYLQDMKGTSITSMTFHVASQASAAQTTVYTVSLAIVSAETFTGDAWGSSYYFLTDETVAVYEGTLDASQATVTFAFDAPFAYEGGNLLLDIQTKTRGNDKDASFYGISTSSVQAVFANGFGGGMPGTSGSGEAFLPKTTFTVSGEVAAPCETPVDLKKDEIGADFAEISWAAGSDETQWQAVVMEGVAEPDWSLAQLVEEPKAKFENLNPRTNYRAYVRSYCAEDRQSFEDMIDFRTGVAVITEIPWSENFNDGLALEGWNAAGSQTISVFSNALMLGFGGETFPSWEMAITPEFDVDWTALAITFKYNTADYNASFEVGYIDAEGAFVVIGEAYPKTKEYTLVENVLLHDVPAEVKHLAFRATSQEPAFVYVDDVVVDEATEATAISNTTAGKNAVKRIVNGQLVIEHNGVRYNVLGTELK